MVLLTLEEKSEICAQISQHLTKIRKLLKASQSDLSYLCGLSRTRISQIENGIIIMNWSQLTSILCICFANLETKEYLFVNRLINMRFLQFMQRKDYNVPPEHNIIVNEQLLPTTKDYMDTIASYENK